MLTKIKKKTEGFTIVEVMIVLAIAGLILLVVLLAVPALNRTARNNRRRTDVTALLGAVSEYSNNNNGSLPANTDDITSLAKLSYYDPEADEVDYAVLTGPISGPPGPDENIVYIRNYAKCSGNAVTGTGATRRNVVAFFRVETTAGTTTQCQES